ncbi:MAG TPA: hypothetical protein VFU22_24210 [Roseiflexaceae bacterium]|nr:hypothetical protein [Roseiflexaceae bacterium]
MSEIDERLDRGVEIFRRAGDDSALLGAALLAFHGALERFLDDELRERPELSADERRLLEAGRLGWPARARLAEQTGLLSHEQAGRAIEATRARIALARGDACAWPAGAVETYGQMVATRCGRMELIRWIDQRPERAKKTVATPIPPVWEPEARSRFPFVRIAVSLLFLLTFAAVVWTIYTQLDGPRLLRSVGALPAPTVAAPAPTEPIAPTATRATRTARITGLGGGPGWLHATASFDSPTRAIRLADGMQVTLRDEQQTDSNGVRWQLVAVGGYEGWCPENNLLLEDAGG